jgi:hypothetical protein
MVHHRWDNCGVVVDDIGDQELREVAEGGDGGTTDLRCAVCEALRNEGVHNGVWKVFAEPL